MPVVSNIYYYLFEGSEEGLHPPVVLLHGAGGTHLYWPWEIRRLPGYRVFALDLPGHGKSSGRGRQSIAAYADAILEWMEGLQMHTAVFVGHSMGSAIALSLALNHPEHVLGIGLVGAGARLRVAGELIDGTASQATFYSAVERLVQWSFSAAASPRLVELALQRMAETRVSVLHSDLLACDDFDALDRVAEIRKPTLVICGVDDKMTPLRYAQFLANSIPNARLKIIHEAGHMVMLEQPQATAAALVDFLADIPY